MSDQRPEWMPDTARINRDFYENVHRYSAAVKAETLCAETGLRAQIAVLEEMREQLTGKMTHEADAIIFAKLTALRKELEHG